MLIVPEARDLSFTLTGFLPRAEREGLFLDLAPWLPHGHLLYLQTIFLLAVSMSKFLLLFLKTHTHTKQLYYDIIHIPDNSPPHFLAAFCSLWDLCSLTRD